ncbi:MAG: long-chain fatty acid--CoA ligase, partial [Chlorobiales bacterium]|nr:long-chain fatty acid--CoA ligase [Chlorobiales bacterium]
MALINDSFKTLPELFDGVFKHYKGQTKYPLSKKDNGAYEGITYDQLARDVESFAAYLRSLGVEKGDRVAILSENRPAWVTADMAILKIGAIDVPLYPSLPPNQISYIIQNSECKAVVVSTQLQLSKIRKIISEVPSLKQIIAIHNIESPQPNEIEFMSAIRLGETALAEQPDILKGIQISENDLATLIYTSGTTGNPKGVMLTHRNICENVKSCSKILNIDENDASLSFLPLCHAYERTAGYYLMFACGVPIYYAESIETVSMNISEVKPTVVITVPRLFERIRSTMMKTIDNSGDSFRKKMFHWALDVGYKHMRGMYSPLTGAQMLTGLQYKLADKIVFSKIRERFGGRIRFFVSGGAALPKETGEFFQVLGITILEGFGLTETSPVTHVNRPGKVKFGTVGPAVANVDVKIASDGEILLRGPNIMKGYWRDEAATAESIIDGWLHTGDIGEIDKDGYLKITDRKKHIIVNSGG